MTTSSLVRARYDPVSTRAICRPVASSLLLSDALTNTVEPICHDSSNSQQVVGGSKATNWQISSVLDRIVAASRRHVLRHGVWRCARRVDDNLVRSWKKDDHWLCCGELELHCGSAGQWLPAWPEHLQYRSPAPQLKNFHIENANDNFDLAST